MARGNDFAITRYIPVRGNISITLCLFVRSASGTYPRFFRSSDAFQEHINGFLAVFSGWAFKGTCRLSLTITKKRLSANHFDYREPYTKPFLHIGTDGTYLYDKSILFRTLDINHPMLLLICSGVNWRMKMLLRT